MITAKIFEHLDAAAHASDFAYTAHALTRVARLAVESEGIGEQAERERGASVAKTLEMVEALVEVALEGVEQLEKRAGATRL